MDTSKFVQIKIVKAEEGELEPGWCFIGTAGSFREVEENDCRGYVEVTKTMGDLLILGRTKDDTLRALGEENAQLKKELKEQVEAKNLHISKLNHDLRKAQADIKCWMNEFEKAKSQVDECREYHERWDEVWELNQRKIEAIKSKLGEIKFNELIEGVE